MLGMCVCVRMANVYLCCLFAHLFASVICILCLRGWVVDSVCVRRQAPTIYNIYWCWFPPGLVCVFGREWIHANNCRCITWTYMGLPVACPQSFCRNVDVAFCACMFLFTVYFFGYFHLYQHNCLFDH